MITIDIRTEKGTSATAKFYLYLNDFGSLSMCGEDDDKNDAHVCAITHSFYPGSHGEWKACIIDEANKALGLLEQ